MAKTSSQTNQPKNAGTGNNNSLLKEFFLESLMDIYYAEKAIAKALPTMTEAATSETLVDAFTEHLSVTNQQITRLEEVFEIFGEKAKGKKCEAIEGIIKEAEGIIEETEDGTLTRDVGLIMAAQKVEHYEIATYGGLHQLAITLGNTEAAELLQKTLFEEKETDVLLSKIAENDINYQAAEEQG